MKYTPYYDTPGLIFKPLELEQGVNTDFRGFTLRTGFHVKSKCLKVGRIPTGLWPAAWAGAADLLGRVSQTRTLLNTKHQESVCMQTNIAPQKAG